MANRHKKQQAENQKAKGLPKGRPLTKLTIKLTPGKKYSNANSENTQVESVPPHPHPCPRPRPAYKGAKAGQVTITEGPGPAAPAEQEEDVQAATLLLDLAGNHNAARGQLKSIKDKAVGNESEVEAVFEPRMMTWSRRSQRANLMNLISSRKVLSQIPLTSVSLLQYVKL